MITSSFEAMARLFEASLAELGPDAPRPNVSPTEPVPVVVSHDGDRTIVPMRWGLLPPLYRTANGGPLLINARAEGIAEKPAFREAVPRAALPGAGGRLLRVAGREGGAGAATRSGRAAAG